MADITFNCRHCNQSLEAPEAMAGTCIPCPACKNNIQVPQPSTPIESTTAIADIQAVQVQTHQPTPETTATPIMAKTAPTVGKRPCPFCGEEIMQTAVKCRHCGEFLEGKKSPTSSVKPIVQSLREGRFTFSCPYDQAIAIVEQSMMEADVNIKERSPSSGLIKGKCRYGINPFGITVTCTFYSDAGGVQAELAVSLTDSFDTMGVCKKKMEQISDRILSRAMSGSGRQFAVSGVQRSLSQQPISPPSYAQRAGPSHKGKATTGFCLSIVGLLFFGPAAIVGLIMCGLALTGMSTSTCKDGKGLAVAGLVIGLIALLVWIGLVAILYNNR